MSTKKELLKIVQHITDLAFKLKVPNMICPEIVQACISLRFMINYEEHPPGQTPKPDPMPQTPKEWKYLGDLYEKALMAAQLENSELRIKINGMTQRLESQRRTIKGMLETPNEF